MWEFWLGYWWAVLIYGLAFGFVTKIVIKNKGYQEGKWFWWGFFFGVFAFSLNFRYWGYFVARFGVRAFRTLHTLFCHKIHL